MRTDGQEENLIVSSEAEDDPVLPVDSETPNLPALRFQLLGMQRGVKRIIVEEFFLFLGFSLDSDGKLLVAFVELLSNENFEHGNYRLRRNALSEVIFSTLPAR